MQQMENDVIVKSIGKLFNQSKSWKKLFHSDTLLEGSVKLTSMQLVGESMAAISVPLEAILKLENVDYCGKRLSESAVLLM